MSDGPGLESGLDSLGRAFPLPYRVAAMIILAVWGWSINLHYLHAVGIDVPALICYPPRVSPSQPSHHYSAYRLAAFLLAAFVASIALFWLYTSGDSELVVYYGGWPVAFLILLAIAFVLPLRSLSLPHGGRRRLLYTLRRISLGGLAEVSDGKFGDIILADVLTTYARVLADLFICICMSFSQGVTATSPPNRSIGGLFAIPFVMAIPNLIRLRQCLIEYVRVRNGPKGHGWGGQHLANAAKYASVFPTLILNAVRQRDPDNAFIHRAWLLALLVNSLYSFYWDVTMDWGLTLFTDLRDSPDYPFGLRRGLLIHRPIVYHSVIVIDLILRCTWLANLSLWLGNVTGSEGLIFLLEILEAFRRWVWVFFRVETEWIRNTAKGSGVDEMLLGEDHYHHHHQYHHHQSHDVGGKYQDEQ